MKRSEFLKIFGGTMLATQLPHLLDANNLAAANQASAALRGEVIPDIKLDIHPSLLSISRTHILHGYLPTRWSASAIYRNIVKRYFLGPSITSMLTYAMLPTTI